MNTVQKISTPKFLYVYVQTVFKKTTLYILWYIYERKKKGFYTNLCRFEIFSMKIVYAMKPEL